MSAVADTQATRHHHAAVATFTLRAGPVAVRVKRRSVGVIAGSLLVVLVLAAFALATGDFPLPLRDVVAAAVGAGDPGTEFVVGTLRAPRVLTAVLVGIALGLSGAMFQSLTANPLGSPDVIGFTFGAATGGIVAILLGTGEPGQIALYSIGGGLLTALAVYGLAFRGGLQPYRLVLVGLGVAYTVYSLNAYLLEKASVSDALTAERWLLGSLSGADWSQVRMLGLAGLVLTPAVVVLARPLFAMEVGDDASRALGVRVALYRPLLGLVGVALAAVATAAVGPVSFVALAAPQIGRRLTGAPGPNLVVAGLIGAGTMLAADLAAQRLLTTPLPVGLVTGVVGGLYLTWLLMRRRTA